MQVVRFENAGRLNPVRVERRVWFKVEEVIQVAGTWRRRRRTKKKALDAERRGRLEAQCFALFAAGKDLAEIVMLTECSSDLVEEFYKNYRGGSLEYRYWLQSRERELAREAYRRKVHDKQEALQASREFKLRQAELLAKAGVAKPPTPPPTVGRFARDRLLEAGGLPARPLPGERPAPEGEGSGQSR